MSGLAALGKSLLHFGSIWIGGGLLLTGVVIGAVIKKAKLKKHLADDFESGVCLVLFYLADFNLLHLCIAVSRTQGMDEGIQLVFRTLRYSFDCAVFFIFHPAGYFFGLGSGLSEITESDTLDVAVNN